MHIAVCDDNVADRKQTERLLDRESKERIATTGNLYIDSFGSVDSLIKAPQKYDLFLIDMTQSEPHGIETVNILRDMGVSAPVVLLVSSINYRSYAQIPPDVTFLDKPIKKAELTALLDEALITYSSKLPTIELRDETKAHYVFPDQFVYAVPDRHIMRVKLSDGKTVNQLGSFEDLCRLISPFETFLLISGKIIINKHHVLRMEKRNILMSDGSKFKVGLSERRSVYNIVSTEGSRFISENLTDNNGGKHNGTSDTFPEG